MLCWLVVCMSRSGLVMLGVQYGDRGLIRYWSDTGALRLRRWSTVKELSKDTTCVQLECQVSIISCNIDEVVLVYRTLSGVMIVVAGRAMSYPNTI